MKDPNRFYTYAYLREDRTPYYIGKGQRGRAYQGDGKPCAVPKDKSRIIFLKKNLTEEEAFKHEIYMIAVFGRKDLGTGILRNKTNGGEGPSGLIHNEETKRKISETHKGRKLSENHKRNIGRGLKGKTKGLPRKPLSEEHKRNIGNSGKGRKHSEETKRKQSEGKRGKKYSEETRIKQSEAKKGRKWWNDGCGNSKLSKECPGEGWVPGRGEKPSVETKRKQSEAKLGKKWWIDSYGNTKFAVECPGEGWVLGKTKKVL